MPTFLFLDIKMMQVCWQSFYVSFSCTSCLICVLGSVIPVILKDFDFTILYVCVSLKYLTKLAFSRIWNIVCIFIYSQAVISCSSQINFYVPSYMRASNLTILSKQCSFWHSSLFYFQFLTGFPFVLGFAFQILFLLVLNGWILMGYIDDFCWRKGTTFVFLC